MNILVCVSVGLVVLLWSYTVIRFGVIRRDVSAILERVTTLARNEKYLYEVIKRLQATRERGADVAGLRRRVEAMERDIDEIIAKVG